MNWIISVASSDKQKSNYKTDNVFIRKLESQRQW